ncbi:MAG: hypothetical protein IKA79_02975, partial [Lentisphaeria bacterium]|nr:hypothetical protein [Lentisphaeria bacterium]
MKCQICGRENASIHIREIKDGEKRSYYICKECAAKKSGSADIMGLAKLIHDLTSSLSKLPVQSPDKKPGNSDQNKKNNGDIPFSGFPQIAEMEMIHDLFGNEPEESMPSDENTGPEKHVEP